ncbi:MAG: nuclease-related domain-containing protein, partial [Bacilli bacterium]
MGLLLLFPLISLCFVLAVNTLLKNPKFIGMAGEYIVTKELEKLPGDKYRVLKNLYLSHGWGTTQIDHVVVSQYGIFVVEVKNFTGVVYGKENANQWTQFVGKRKNYFQNPIHQNYAHVQAVKAILPTLADDAFVNVVVFTNRAKLKVTTTSVVVRLKELREQLVRFQHPIL